jgi:hypothetical protein
MAFYNFWATKPIEMNIIRIPNFNEWKTILGGFCTSHQIPLFIRSICRMSHLNIFKNNNSLSPPFWVVLEQSNTNIATNSNPNQTDIKCSEDTFRGVLERWVLWIKLLNEVCSFHFSLTFTSSYSILNITLLFRMKMFDRCGMKGIHYITLHHITSHHIASHHITLHHITSHHIHAISSLSTQLRILS